MKFCNFILIIYLELGINLFYDIQMIPSGKGGICLLLQDYKFTLHITNSDGICYYRCKDHKKKK